MVYASLSQNSLCFMFGEVPYYSAEASVLKHTVRSCGVWTFPCALLMQNGRKIVYSHAVCYSLHCCL